MTATLTREKVSRPSSLLRLVVTVKLADRCFA